MGWVGYVEGQSQVSSSTASIAMFEHIENGGNDSHKIYHNGTLVGERDGILMRIPNSFWIMVGNLKSATPVTIFHNLMGFTVT